MSDILSIIHRVVEPIPGERWHVVTTHGVAVSDRGRVVRVVGVPRELDAYAASLNAPARGRLDYGRAVLTAFDRPPGPAETVRRVIPTRVDFRLANLVWSLDARVRDAVELFRLAARVGSIRAAADILGCGRKVPTALLRATPYRVGEWAEVADFYAQRWATIVHRRGGVDLDTVGG